MPTSKVWPNPLATGTPVMARPDKATRGRVASDAPWIAGTVRQARKGDYAPWMYLVETNDIDDDSGYRESHWCGQRNVRPVDTSAPRELQEWLDG